MYIKFIYKNEIQYIDLASLLLERKENLPLLGFGLLWVDGPIHFFF